MFGARIAAFDDGVEELAFGLFEVCSGIGAGWMALLSIGEGRPQAPTLRRGSLVV